MALNRRRFVAGAGAIAASGTVFGLVAKRAFAEPAVESVPLGTQPKGLPHRQFGWADHLNTDAYGNPVAPMYDRLLFFDVRGRPTPAHARLLESRLRTLERHFAWSHTGLLFTVSWGPSYFKLLGVASPIVAPGVLSTFERPVIDRYDMCLHLASDNQALLAELDAALSHGRAASGIHGSLSLAQAFVLRESRVGFTGKGIPAAHQDVRGIPSGDPVAATSPLFMGFKSGFKKNLATEDAIAITSGPFKDGTTMHVSYMRENLSQWYGPSFTDQDRVSRMYSPETTPAGVNALTDDAESETDEISTAIKQYGVIGHSQATAQARRNNKPLIIRRDFNTVDGGYAGLHFVSVQRTYEDFVVTRNAMNASGAHLGNKQITATKNNGINAFIDVKRRANYIIPSRPQRSFPLLPGRDAVL